MSNTNLIGIASHVAELVKKDLCKIIAYLDSFGRGYCIHEGHAVDNYHFVEVSFIHVRPSLVTSGACVICMMLPYLGVFVVRGNTRRCCHGWSVHGQLFITD